MVTTGTAASAVETLKQTTENENEEMELNAVVDATKELTEEGESDEGKQRVNQLQMLNQKFVKNRFKSHEHI